ncbi:MAG: DegT/DnrJ/EryC1/StrS aminotransferase family protein [Armatimonadetes bacterium]|nr:DegT/DnrJ/EryC1/StrS aminotransferase family protein [Armatimonadota bacterium]
MIQESFVAPSKFIPFSPPLIEEDDIAEVIDTLKSDWITTGPKTREFERRFREEFGCPAALAVSSCTAALHLALVVSGVGPGDEVITVSHTFCSTVNVIEHTGATPILVDVEPDTLNMDPEKLRAAITPKTKAIIPVHYAGHPADMDAINAIAREHGLVVIEDAAHPISGTYKGRYIGSSENPTAFSFYATKNLTTAEGGMLTGTPEFIEKARIAHLHGMTKDALKRYEKGGSWKYEVVMPGFKYNMTDLQASLGLRQLDKLARFQKRRREIVDRYNRAFHSLSQVEIPTERTDVTSSWHLYVLRLNLDKLSIDRDQFIEELKARNIGTSVHYISVHLHPYYRDKYGFKPEDLPVTQANFERIISLPLSAKISDAEVEFVISAIQDILARYSH